MGRSGCCLYQGRPRFVWVSEVIVADLIRGISDIGSLLPRELVDTITHPFEEILQTIPHVLGVNNFIDFIFFSSVIQLNWGWQWGVSTRDSGWMIWLKQGYRVKSSLLGQLQTIGNKVDLLQDGEWAQPFVV